MYTLGGEEVDLEQFLAVNAEGLSEEQVKQARALKPGEQMNFGGGAAPLVTLRRVGEPTDGSDHPVTCTRSCCRVEEAGPRVTRTENGPAQFCRGAIERGLDPHQSRTYTTLHYVHASFLGEVERRFHFCDEHPAQELKARTTEYLGGVR